MDETPSPPAPQYDVPEVSEGDIWDALVASEGNISEAARNLDRTRTFVKERIDRSVTLTTLINDLNEDIVDEAEKNHRKRVRSGVDPTAERFILQTLGKGRGYSTGVAGTGKDGEIVLTIRKFSEKEPE